MKAREAILQRIHAALGAAQQAPLVHACGPQPAAYTDPVGRFIDCATRLASTVTRIAERADVPQAVAYYLQQAGLGQVAVCWPELLDLEWIAAGLHVNARDVEPEDAVGITGAFCAIAETGTLMLLSGRDTPAALSLLPETHIAVVDARRIVNTMEAAWALLRQERGPLPRAVNFVSGPSRTADIEQTVTLGAHGPARVHIVIMN